MAAALRTTGLLLCALSLSACATARGPRPVPTTHTLIPDSRISLAVPVGFQPNPDVGGLESADGRAAIFANEIPGSVYSTMRAYSAEGFEANGMLLHGHERVRVDDWPARLYRATQPVTGADLVRLVLVLGDSGTSVVLTAVSPDEADAVALRAALLSARWHRRGVLAEPDS